MLDSKALTKTQSSILIAMIVFAVVSGSAAYILLNYQEQHSETIKIGILADLDGVLGQNFWQGSVLAAEQINSEGGILGKEIELIGEDHDAESGYDMVIVSSAIKRLITYHKVDVIIGVAGGEAAFVCQEIVAEHKKIFINLVGGLDSLTQRILDDYDKYKYYFSYSFNSTTTFKQMTDSCLVFKENTGFKKVGYLGEDLGWAKAVMDGFDNFLPENGFDLVYKGRFPLETIDFSSYLAAAEAAGVEFLVPVIGLGNGIAFIKEWHDRQSPTIIYGGSLSGAGVPESWKMTDGKCEHISVPMLPTTAGHPLTSKTLSFREAYFDKWEEIPDGHGTSSYDCIRFVLFDAIKRAGTIETNSLINALEKTSIETTSARNYVFTESHCVLVGENPKDPNVDYTLVLLFQWQSGEIVPVYPNKIMEEAGATYTFPDWPGPWD